MSADEPKTTPSEDAVVDQIAAENAQGATDDQYESEQEPEEPTRIIGDEKRHWYSFLKRRKFWVSFVGLLLAGLILAWLITPSRAWILNTLGLRAQVSIATVVNTPQGAPPILKNALVTINGAQHRTGDNGTLTVTLPYGPLRVEVSKPGYETVTKDVTLDFDPFFHYLGGQAADEAVRNQTIIMKSVGIPVTFVAKDWLTGQPITTGHFGIGDVVTTPSPTGEVQLVIPATDAKTVPLTATFDSTYANVTIDIPLPNVPAELTFVAAGKHYFISKRSGQFAVYSSNLDGAAVTEVVPAASNETGDIAFSVSPNGKYGVLASTREATRDNFGSVQQKLYVVDLATNKLTAIDTALRFDIADWSGERVVYTAAYREASGTTVQRLSSADVTHTTHTDLAKEILFQVVRVRLGNAVYLRGDGELRTVKLTGGAEKSLGTGVHKLTQTAANVFAYQIADKSWRQYDVNADQVSTVATPSNIDRAFLAEPSTDGQTYLVADKVDGKPTLIAKAVGNGQEVILHSAADITAPVRWIGTHAVYRVGSADYVISATGGLTKKISDVTPTPTPTSDYFTFN